MYKIRPRNTKPQGLLFLCFILMFIVLALNVVIYQITPQYSTFGSQHYIVSISKKYCTLTLFEIVQVRIVIYLEGIHSLLEKIIFIDLEGTLF